MVPMQDIQRYCAAVAAAFKPQKIILFGSHAYGTPTPDSDVDLLVVMPKPRRYWMQTTQKIHQKVSAGFPVDVLVRDPTFLRERLQEGDCFLQEITTKGRVMYEGSHPRRSPSFSSPGTMTENAEASGSTAPDCSDMSELFTGRHVGQ